MIWLLLVVLLLAIMPLVLATAGVSMLAWAVTYFAVLAGLAVGLGISLRNLEKGPRPLRMESGTGAPYSCCSWVR